MGDDDIPRLAGDLPRWVALCGAGFVVLFCAAAALYGGGAGATQSDIAAYYAASGNRLHQIGGFAVLLAAAVLLLVHVVNLTARIVHDSVRRNLATASGVIGTAFLMLANAMWAATAFTVQIQSGYTVTASAHLLIEDAAFVCLMTGMIAAIPWVLVTAFTGLREGSLPGWFVGLAVLSAVGQATAYWYLPLAGFLVWVAAGSILLLRDRSAAG